MGSYSDEEDNRRIYLVSSALSPEEYRYYPHWFAELVPPGHLTLTLDDMLVFADRFGIAEQDKWKIFDTFESPLSTLEKGEFYAFVRLIGHVMDGKAPSRALVFQQAPVPKIIQEAAVALQSDVTMSPSASQRSSLTLPASTAPSPSNPPSGLPVSPVPDGTRVNPFRRHHEQKSRQSHESRKSAESMTRTVSAETPETRSSSTDKASNDIQAVDAFTQMLLGEVSDAIPRKSSESAVSDHSSLYQVGISETKQNDPIFEMSDESSSSSSEDEDDEAVDEESTSTAKNMTPDDSISLGSIGKLDFQQPTIHTIQSQHYLVMPKELELNPPPRKSLETDHSKRPAPPPPRPRKGGYGAQSSVSVSNPVVTATMTPSSEPSTVPLSSVGSSRSLSSSSLPKSLSAPGPPISHADKRKSSVGGLSPSLSSTPSFNSSQKSSSTPDVSAPAHATFSDVEFNAAFDGQQLFPAVGSPPDTRANAPQTALPSQKSHVPPPPPPSRRKVSHAKYQSIASAHTTRGHRPHPQPHPPPPPPPPSAASHSLSNSTSGTTSAPSSQAASVDDSAVPDLLADLTALQREVDALREQHLHGS
ncbi:hypothetical protein V1515DRAFT_584456 [Lipomyces mesembrius]